MIQAPRLFENACKQLWGELNAAMGRRSQIAAAAIVLVVLLIAGGAYAYDNSRKDKIAEGVTIAGVDVGADLQLLAR